MHSSLLRLARRQMEVQIRLRAISWFSLSLLILQPAVFAGVGFVLARMAGRGAPDLVYTIIGGGVMGMWSSLIFTSFSDITRDRREGTLELIVGSPTSLTRVLALRTLANVLVCFLSLLVSFTIAEIWFRYSLPPGRVGWILAAVAALLFSLWCLGMFLANFHAWSRVTGNAINFLELPVAVICGFMFPISVLPGWLRLLSGPIPLTWAVSALNGALTGAETLDVALRIGLALALSGGFWLLSVWLGRLVHDRIRQSGGLGML
jgi:ABC-2 type transport system permease protein